MELFEFEKDAKTRLSNRELDVSKNAWGRLATHLDAQEKKKGAKNYRYLLIAASMVGVLFVIMFYSTVDTDKNMPDVLTVSPEVLIKERSLVVENSEIEIVKEQETGNIVESEEKNVVVVVTKPRAVIPVVKTKPEKEIDVGYSDIVSKEDAEEALLLQAYSDSLIQEKALALTTVITLLEKENEEVTDAEIDALLREAQEQILTHKYYKGQQGVDATALLLNVEAELDQSFKEQVFEALKTSFNKVRTAMRR